MRNRIDALSISKAGGVLHLSTSECPFATDEGPQTCLYTSRRDVPLRKRSVRKSEVTVCVFFRGAVGSNVRCVADEEQPDTVGPARAALEARTAEDWRREAEGTWTLPEQEARRLDHQRSLPACLPPSREAEGTGPEERCEACESWLTAEDCPTCDEQPGSCIGCPLPSEACKTCSLGQPLSDDEADHLSPEDAELADWQDWAKEQHERRMVQAGVR